MSILWALLGISWRNMEEWAESVSKMSIMRKLQDENGGLTLSDEQMVRCNKADIDRLRSERIAYRDMVLRLIAHVEKTRDVARVLDPFGKPQKFLTKLCEEAWELCLWR